MQTRPYIKAAFAASIGAIVASALSFWADYTVGHDVMNLFSRSGALLGLSAAVLEYQLGIGSYLRNQYKPGTQISMGQLAEAFNLTNNERRLREFAHSLLAVGTIIWAYGDLAFKVFA